MTHGTGAPRSSRRWDGHGEGPVDRSIYRGACVRCLPSSSGSIRSTPVTEISNKNT